MKIPKSAMPVVEYIRENVERPKELPTPMHKDGTDLRFDFGGCPMGLCKEARAICPDDPKFFRPLPHGFSHDAIASFADWWDSQTDPQAAVDAIWGKE